MSQEKLINDPIHGYMTFKKWAVEFIDTKAFQRLRDIKQLGNCYYIFPGACHNRFEHSLGTAHLAYTLAKKLLEQPGIERVNNDLECVTLAALCHDLGHGPFSHVFDGDWKHEDGSEKMFDYLYDNMETHSIDLSTDDLKFIKNLIKGDRTKRSPYLFDIVSNKRNSVDVDKFDYLARDCYYLGMISLFDSPRLMRFSYVTEDQIVYHHKECFNIYEMFHTRYTLYKNELQAPLKKLKEIIEKIRNIKLYKFVNECFIPPDKKDKIIKKDLESLIASYRKDPNKVFSLDTDGICYLFPKQYEETILRIFARDPEKVDSIQNAFREFTKSIGLSINEGFLPDENVDFLDINLKDGSQDDKIKPPNVP
ncbi:hypothetical protein C2G38_2153930 [Gigaspora rosea]|uniref:HD/PDEase domain-containing protein n=1 Tax=Gigaspora rosea TaxID=44941 RepID=A0A397W7C6_9GLOM|nr:hypothetical protein C2G38_2153930 [Gigaspora rosea]